jgi:single-strand DNA-binding protein
MASATSAAAGSGTRGKVSTAAHHNEVSVTGRLSTAAEERDLPSGDVVIGWRLVVERPPDATRPGYDVIDCAAFGARVRRAALGWQPGSTIQVDGALRRRFWRSEGGTASRYEVEVRSAKRLA